jgi:hypothetical protein
MKCKLKLAILFVLLLNLITMVYADLSNIPPAPEPDPYPVKIVKCIDSDGGINYLERGTISYDIIKWDAPKSHIPPESGQTDYCSESIGVSKGSCNPTSKILKEAYCEAGEINMVPKEGETPSETVKYTSYDCSSENKVCYKGNCVEDNEELKQSEEYKKEVQECEEVRKEMGFWQRISNWFKGIFS